MHLSRNAHVGGCGQAVDSANHFRTRSGTRDVDTRHVARYLSNHARQVGLRIALDVGIHSRAIDTIIIDRLLIDERAGVSAVFIGHDDTLGASGTKLQLICSDNIRGLCIGKT